MTITDRFAEHDDVGNDSITLKSPEMRADAAVSCLNFIRNADATRISNSFVNVIQIPK